MIFTIVLLSVFSIIKSQNGTEKDAVPVRASKALSVFQVVRFPNIGCVGSSSLNGTCYTASECTNKAGTSAGSCASGFGVCCTFTLGCGGTIAENCSYFQSTSSGQAAGQCGVTICKCSTDICQLRLDFTSFVITGPSTISLTQFAELNGNPIFPVAGGKSASTATQCLTDSFSVTGNGGQSPSPICGINTGYHMYVDASPSCNQLLFELGPTAIGTSIATRSWNIKVSQISCYSTYLPPPGCTQYLTGTSGTLNSYNYAGSVEIANQHQTICMRRERGYCRICFSPTSTTDFQISAMTAIAKGFVKNTICCGYGTTGKGTMGYDCVVIPGAVKTTPVISQVGNQFCGGVGFATATGITGKTVCSYTMPFQLQFITDGFTMATAIAAKIKGFKIAYWETTC